MAAVISVRSQRCTIVLGMILLGKHSSRAFLCPSYHNSFHSMGHCEDSASCQVHLSQLCLEELGNNYRMGVRQTQDRIPFKLLDPHASVCQGCCNKVIQPGWLKLHKFMVPQFQRLAIQEQGVSRIGSFRGLRGRTCSRPVPQLLAVCWQSRASLGSCCSILISPSSSHGILPVFVAVSTFPPSIWHQSYWIKGPPCSIMTSS